MKKVRCFVSFCVKDKPEWMVKAFLESLESAEPEIEYEAYFQQRYGESLSTFMSESLLAADTVLVLLGPEYKRRVDGADTESGVFQEYEAIVERLTDHDRYKKPAVIPVIWKGSDPNECFPSYFKYINPYAADFSTFIPTRSKKRGIITPSNFSDSIYKLAKSLLDSGIGTNDEFVESYSGKLGKLLHPLSSIVVSNKSIENILRHKFEHTQLNPDFFYKNLFTKTKFFQEIENKNVALIKGRKGSGKTTLVQMIETSINRARYFEPIDIEIDSWNLHYIFDSNVYKQAEGDFGYADIEAKLFDFTWPMFVAITMIDAIHREIGSDPFKRGFMNDAAAEERLQNIFYNRGESNNYYSQIFLLSIECVRRYIQNVVNNSISDTEEAFKIEVSQKINIKKILFYYFGNSFENIGRLIDLSDRNKFLFSIDRFDTELQRYRKDSIEKDVDVRRKRALREVEWLSSLTHFVEKVITPSARTTDHEVYSFFSRVNFVVVLPYDRVEEIRFHQRDSVAGEPIQEISWQPKELLTMLRKRIQVLHEIDDDSLLKTKNRTPLQRYRECVKQTNSDIPVTTYINTAGRRHEIDFFLSVLRHSFFRPRDIIIYYAAILAYCETAHKRKEKPSEEVIHDIISRETRTIVDFEFIGELKDSWTNINEVLNEFRGGVQVLSFRDLEAAIGPIDFEFYREADIFRDIGRKIRILYEIGFLGYRNPKEAGTSSAQKEFTFSMFEKRTPAFDVPRVREKMTYAIHPIFIESLFLTVNNDHPVLNLTWDWVDRWDR